MEKCVWITLHHMHMLDVLKMSHQLKCTMHKFSGFFFFLFVPLLVVIFFYVCFYISLFISLIVFHAMYCTV